MRLGLRDQIAGWQAVVADTWDIDECKDTWSDRVDQVETAGAQVERAAHDDLASGRSRTAVTRVGGGRVRGTLLAGRFGGLGLKTIGWRVSQVWASKPGRRSRGLGGAPEAGRTTRGGIGEFASKRSYR